MSNLISVIVPVYNAERYVERCVRSICDQTYRNLEIILVNDGSTDNSKIICEKLSKNDSRIKLINQSNGGSSIARNTGLDHATGDIISFVDSDDHIVAHMLETMLNILNQHNLDVVEIERNSAFDNSRFDNSFTIEKTAQATARIIRTTGFQCWKRIYRRSVVADLRFIPKIIHQDVFFTIDVVNKVDKIGFLNSPLYIYNRDSVGIIRSKYSKMKRDIAIKATEYLQEKTVKDPEVIRAMNDYIVSYYTDHFFLLSRNTKFDKNKTYRKKLRHEIKGAINTQNRNLRSMMAAYCPLSVMELLSTFGKSLKSRLN